MLFTSTHSEISYLREVRSSKHGRQVEQAIRKPFAIYLAWTRIQVRILDFHLLPSLTIFSDASEVVTFIVSKDGIE
jgi:hypothetical protein